MSLIGRALEDAGIPTTGISTARDITAAARPSRSVFVDFPHGHTTGRVGDTTDGESIVRSALALLDDTTPDRLVDLDLAWGETDGWKDTVYRARPSGGDGTAKMVDSRTERRETPQYQSSADEAAAAETHADQDCLVCIGIDI